MNNRIKILIIEDDVGISNFISTTLKVNQYGVVLATTGKEAISMLTSHCPDVILLDLGLPDMDGLLVLKEIRSICNTPVIVVSARTDESDKVSALDMDADDYITKPFGTDELLARIRTAIRHSHKMAASQQGKLKYQAKELIIDFEKRRVLMGDKEIHLTQIEYKIVSMLAQNAGRVLTYDHIITALWGPYALKDNQILRVNMAHIRRKLEQNPAEPQYIFTEVGVGYRMIEETK